jgi:hypothetical protein
VIKLNETTKIINKDKYGLPIYYAQSDTSFGTTNLLLNDIYSKKITKKLESVFPFGATLIETDDYVIKVSEPQEFIARPYFSRVASCTAQGYKKTNLHYLASPYVASLLMVTKMGGKIYTPSTSSCSFVSNNVPEIQSIIASRNIYLLTDSKNYGYICLGRNYGTGLPDLASYLLAEYMDLGVMIGTTYNRGAYNYFERKFQIYPESRIIKAYKSLDYKNQIARISPQDRSGVYFDNAFTYRSATRKVRLHYNVNNFSDMIRIKSTKKLGVK